MAPVLANTHGDRVAAVRCRLVGHFCKFCTTNVIFINTPANSTNLVKKNREERLHWETSLTKRRSDRNYICDAKYTLFSVSLCFDLFDWKTSDNDMNEEETMTR